MSVDDPDIQFRVIVSLERYFSDERARCYMSVDRSRPVRWLARRLRRTFSLPRPFALLCRGHLLPPDEPLALLARDDPLDVIPASYAVSLSSKRTRPNDEDEQKTPAAHIPAEAAADVTDGTRLEDLKRRALQLLDECTAGAAPLQVVDECTASIPQVLASVPDTANGLLPQVSDGSTVSSTPRRRKRVRAPRRRRAPILSAHCVPLAGECVAPEEDCVAPVENSVLPMECGSLTEELTSLNQCVPRTEEPSPVVIRNECTRPREPRRVTPLHTHFTDGPVHNCIN